MTAQAVRIVGGGITGLAAAYELHRARIPFTLYEKSPRLGGIIRTDYTGALVIDAGPDAMLARKRAGLELCAELGIAGRLVAARPPREAFILRDGVLQPIPRMAWRSQVDPGRDESIADFFRARFGEEAVDRYAEPLLAGIHTGEVERLSIAALFADAGRNGEGEAPDPDGEFRSFPRGMQELVDALAAALPRESIRLGAAVESLRDHLADGPVIVAVPAHAAAALVAPLDPELAELCRGIRYVSSAIVVLAYPRAAIAHPLAGSGFVVPRVERDTRILAATWLSSKWPGRAPEHVALMRAFFGGTRDPDAMALDDRRLAAIARHNLARVLGIAGAPLLTRVYRWPDGTPQYEVGYLARLAAIRRRACAHRGLVLAGAGFGTIGIPDCIQAGREAARATVRLRQPG